MKSSLLLLSVKALPKHFCGVGVWRMVERQRKEKDLVVGQIGFLWGDYGWLGLYQTGWLGLGDDIRYFFESFKRNIATVSTCIVCGNISTGCTVINLYFFDK